MSQSETRPNRQLSKDRTIVRYDSSGLELSDSSKELVAAQSIDDLIHTTYQILVNQEHHVYQPKDKYYQSHSAMIAKSTGVPIYKLITVGKRFFDLYLQYLRTGRKELVNSIKLEI